MKGDFTRDTFVRAKHYQSVRLQQGRVGPLDAEWNEQRDLDAYASQTTHTDVIGRHGGPKGQAADGQPLAGFAITAAGAELMISPGRYYVDGILCENEQATPLTAQPDLPAYDPFGITSGSGAAAGRYLAYLDIWARHLTALDDPDLREVALGGPDTTTRLKTLWQVKLELVGALGDALTCADFGPNWTPPNTTSTGTLAARAEPTAADTGPCLVPPDAGYRRLENQLYRVEIHQGGAVDSATFLWSRENGAIVTRWEAQDGNNLTVSSAGRDRVLGFAAGDWVELTDDTYELYGQPGVLVRLTQVDGDMLTIDPTTVQGATTVEHSAFPRNPKIRRWDSAGALAVTIPGEHGGWLALEDGVEIHFATGDYRTGDYWLIPARTALGNVLWPQDATPNSPQFQPRHGLHHGYCPLAIVEWRPEQAAPLTVLADCRPLFPTLTNLCAEDICFESDSCDLPDAKTVQAAIDQLCQRNDLPHHNKHLHGWGIVCGLQVTCGPHEPQGARGHITVHDGYALDCAGNDIILRDRQRLDFLSLIERHRETTQEALLDNTGNGDVCLILQNDPAQPFRLERYQPAAKRDLWQVLLKGTLLMDFYERAVKRLVDFVRDEFTVPAAEERRGAGPTAERVAAFTNLMAQPVNPVTGQYIYVSPREHQIMLDFYTRLRALLQSETYCAMFDHARPFPDYPRELREAGMDTVFGRGFHTRLRLHPRTGEGYTVGAGLHPLKPATTIHRYQLTGEEKRLIAQIDPVAGAEIDKSQSDSGVGAVQDVAFSADGRLIYVIIATRGEENTFFRVGQIRGDTITWQPIVMICGVKLVTLATTAADPRNVYAVGMKKITIKDASGRERVEFRGTGLYRLAPDSVQTEMTPLVAFNACGHLRITDDGRAFATAAAENVAPTEYDRIMPIRVPQGQLLFQGPILLEAAGSDDIALFSGPTNRQETLYTVVGPTRSTKFLRAYRLRDGAPMEVNLPLANTALRLEAFRPTSMLLVAAADGYNVQLVDLNTNTFVENYLLPMQVGPAAVATDLERGSAYVLNAGSNTITTIERAHALHPEFRFELKALAAYRAAILNAFTDLLAGLLQYLKDALCQLLLVECPECTGDEKLALACVSIRGGQVERVCNFSERKYVKSFPTVGYWLSLVPIVPLIDYAVEQLCCLALPNLFNRVVTQPSEKQYNAEYRPTLSTVGIFQGAGLLRTLNLGDQVGRFLSNLGSASNVTLDRLRTTTATPAPTPSVGTRATPGSLVDQPVDRVTHELTDQGITVRRLPYDPRQVTNVTSIFRTPTAGSEVTLFEEDGLVRYYAVAAPTTTPVALQQQVQQLAHTVKERESELQLLRSQVATLSPAPVTPVATPSAAPTSDEMAALRAEVAELRQFRAEVTAFMRQPQRTTGRAKGGAKGQTKPE
ncbi:MAG: hypothetical protein KF832_05010 [Caldilineaceae bacterium]|nr:hypothetical protein [Caldilineaceae bacterium]